MMPPEGDLSHDMPPVSRQLPGKVPENTAKYPPNPHYSDSKATEGPGRPYVHLDGDLWYRQCDEEFDRLSAMLARLPAT